MSLHDAAAIIEGLTKFKENEERDSSDDAYRQAAVHCLNILTRWCPELREVAA